MIAQLAKPESGRHAHAGLLLVLAFSWLVLFAAPDGARAQTQYGPPPALLTDISAAPDKDGVRVALSFTPRAPKFSLINNGTAKPSIAFALSTRGVSAVAPASLNGLLTSLEFEQADTVLVIHFKAASPVQIDVIPDGDQVIHLKLRPAGPRHAVLADAPPPPVASEPLSADEGFEVVPLKYADVSEVVGLLTQGMTVKSNDTFTPHEPAFGSAGMGGQATFTPATPESPDDVDAPLGQSVDQTIAIDRRLNAIILKGPPELIAALKAKIALIDVPVQSVILETMFVELDETGAKNVGLDLNNANNQIGVATFQSGDFLPGGLSIGHGLTSAQLQAAIYAEVQKGRGRIVSKPRIAAQSGSTAKIITGDALPISTAITLSGVNGVSQQVQYVNVGVTLQIA
ncbi:MAG TPA: secretin N-terminal domain-containing protein, partial [Caulobacteraceae bacterium]|nr:secretin N-terminal domain-containing protein [Caulobacteraceae bacterium]